MSLLFHQTHISKIIYLKYFFDKNEGINIYIYILFILF
jgi:hypothetical protein